MRKTESKEKNRDRKNPGSNPTPSIPTAKKKPTVIGALKKKKRGKNFRKEKGKEKNMLTAQN